MNKYEVTNRAFHSKYHSFDMIVCINLEEMVMTHQDDRISRSEVVARTEYIQYVKGSFEYFTSVIAEYQFYDVK